MRPTINGLGRRLSRGVLAAALAGLVLTGAAHAAQHANGAAAQEIPIEGPIGPAVSRYVTHQLAQAATKNAPLVILRIDTPGGLSRSMRQIVQAVLASPVPVVGYVAPSGARAASAGTYILYATPIAAMAPATNLGAATPITIGPGGDSGKDRDSEHSEKSEGNAGHGAKDDTSTEHRKRINDAVAYIRGLAEKNHRNADWAEHAVRQAASLSAKSAVEKNVVDFIARDEKALLARLDGQRIQTAHGSVTLHTSGLAIEEQTPGWTTELLAVITDPTVAYLLFVIGIAGLLFEGLNPGAALPGIVGGVCLIAALFAFQILPVNFAGVGLIALGVALMIGEAFAPSFGALGLGGAATFIFGSIMLMNTGVVGFQIPIAVITGIAVAGVLVMLLTVYLFLKSRRQRVHTGHAGLIGRECVALEDFEREGRVHLHGELWFAASDRAVHRDDVLIVESVKGLKVFVRPANDPSKEADS